MQIDLAKHLSYEPPPPAIPPVMDERLMDDKRRKPQHAKTAQFEPKKIWQMHHEIINLHVLGWKNTDIAKKVGATKEHISSIVNSSAAKAKISLLRGERDAKTFDVLKEVEKLLPEAVKTYERILAGDEGTVQLRKSVADTVIKDICGYQAPKKFQTASVFLTPDDLEEFKSRGIQAAIEAGIVIDADYTEG
jgi:hypothetical protein